MPRANVLKYGKIELHSEVESMDGIVKSLGDILNQHGYPTDSGVEEMKDQKKRREEAEAEVKKKQDELDRLLKHGTEEELHQKDGTADHEESS